MSETVTYKEMALWLVVGLVVGWYLFKPKRAGSRPPRRGDEMSDHTPATTPAVSQGPETRSPRRASRLLTLAVGFYLVLVAVLSAYIIIAIFPKVDMKALNPEQVEKLHLKKTSDKKTSDNVEARWQGLINLEFNPLKIRDREIMPELEPAQGLLVLALLGGILGSFMHAAQSFAKF